MSNTDDLQLSKFTLERKLTRYKFKNSFDEHSKVLKVGRSKPSFRFVSSWIVLPFILIMVEIIRISISYEGNPLDFVDIIGLFALVWLLTGFSVVSDWNNLNNQSFEVSPNNLIIKRGSKKYRYSSKEIEEIQIDDSKNYVREQLYFLRRGHLKIKTSDGLTHHFLYIFGNRILNIWDDLRYLKKHILEILESS